MDSFKKMAIGFGLVSVITLQGLQANKLKECESDADKASGCVEIEYYPNGDIRAEIPWKNDELNGVQKVYYTNGQLAAEIPYTKDSVNGIVKVYYDTGVLAFEGFVLRGSINFAIGDYGSSGTGDHKYYSEDGKLLGIARYDKEARFQFVKCAEKKLSHEEAAGLKSALTFENFEKYCSKIEEKHGNEE